MTRLYGFLGAMLLTLAPSQVSAQSSAQPVLPGLLTTSGCTAGVTVCYVPYSSSNPLPVAATGSGNQNVNVSQVNGAAVNVGAGAASTGTQRVVTATDSTIATITNALPAGTNLLGKVGIDQTTPGTTNAVVATGNVASGVSDSGNPVKVAGTNNNTVISLSNAQRGDLQLDASGNLRVRLSGTDLTRVDGVAGTSLAGVLFSDGNSGSTSVRLLATAPWAYNGGTLDSIRTIQGADGTGLGVTATAISPNSNANNAASSQQCTVACASTIVSGAHNLYGLSFSSTATGWLLLEDATSCAANGTITPLRAYAYPTANVTTTVSWGNIPLKFATGLAACFSTTGPFTATTSTTAYITVDYK